MLLYLQLEITSGGCTDRGERNQPHTLHGDIDQMPKLGPRDDLGLKARIQEVLRWRLYESSAGTYDKSAVHKMLAVPHGALELTDKYHNIGVDTVGLVLGGVTLDPKVRPQKARVQVFHRFAFKRLEYLTRPTKGRKQ